MRNMTRAALPIATTVIVVGALLPHTTAGAWASMRTALDGVSGSDLFLLSGLWFAGVLAYLPVLTAALPGLTIPRALFLSLTGSAVSNAMPVGGAFGTAMNYSMCRRWGHSPMAFALFSVVTHVWGLIAKLALPTLALTALLVCDRSSTSVVVPAAVTLVPIGAVLVALSAMLGRECVAAAAGRTADRVARHLGRALGRAWAPDLAQQACEVRAQTIALTRRGWPRPALAMVAHVALQAFLLWMCLRTVGCTVGPVQVFVAFAIERLLSVVAVTPGGVGVVELAMTAMLSGFGGAPATVAAGVLLYRTFTFVLTIPLGGVLLLGWLTRCRRTVGAFEAAPELATILALPLPEPVPAGAAA